MSEGKKRLSYGLYAALLLLVIGAGRVSMTVYNNVSVDIAYAPWFADVFQYATDILNGAKIALMVGAIAYSTHFISKKSGNVTMLFALGGLFVENAARFVIDWVSSSVAYYGVPLILISLFSRFLYEGLLVLAAWGIARLFLKRSWKAVSSARLSVVLFMAAQLVGEIRYLAEHLSLYGGMTSQEIAVCVGSFLNIVVMYGGIPLLLCEAVFRVMKRITIEEK